MRNLGYIKHILGPMAPIQAKKVLYMSLVRSLLSYCTALLSPTKKNEILCLESVQRQATCFILNYRDLNYLERLVELNILPLTYIREIQDLMLTYDIIHSRINVDMDRWFITNDNDNDVGGVEIYRKITCFDWT